MASARRKLCKPQNACHYSRMLESQAWALSVGRWQAKIFGFIELITVLVTQKTMLT